MTQAYKHAIRLVCSSTSLIKVFFFFRFIRDISKKTEHFSQANKLKEVTEASVSCRKAA